MQKLTINLIKILVSAGLILYILLYQVELVELWSALTQAMIAPLVLAAILMVTSIAIRSLRWQVVLRALDIQVPLNRLVHLYFIGGFFNLFLPTGMGGDAIKMARLAQTTGRAPESIGVTLVERATGLWVLFVLALLALPFSYDLLPVAWIVPISTIALVGVVAGWLMMATPLLPWLGSKIRLPGQAALERFYRSVSLLGYKALGLACLVSLVFNLSLIWVMALISQSLGLDLPVGLFFLFTPVISFSLTLPISVGGLGVREQTFILLFAAAGVTAATATAMSLLFYILTTLLIGLIGGGLYILENIYSSAMARHNART
jgi:glycosyltransferase 2 family protein